MRQDETPIEERLAALADGELPSAEAAALRARIAADPELAELYALFVETRALLEPEDADRVEDDQAGLDRLAASVRAAAGSEPAPRRAFGVIEGGGGERTGAPAPTAATSAVRPAARFRIAAPALAAAIALGVGGVLGFAVGRGGPGAEPGGEIAAIAGAPGAAAVLASALERAPSGESLAWTDASSRLKGAVSVIATHRLKDGRVCREYEASVEGRDAVAIGLGCRGSDGAWRTEIVARGGGTGTDYGAASGASVVENALEGMGGEGAVPAEEEKRLIGSSWAGVPR